MIKTLKKFAESMPKHIIKMIKNNSGSTSY